MQLSVHPLGGVAVLEREIRKMYAEIASNDGAFGDPVDHGSYNPYDVVRDPNLNPFERTGVSIAILHYPCGRYSSSWFDRRSTIPTPPDERPQLGGHPLGGARGPPSRVNGGTCVRRVVLAVAILIGLLVVYAVAHLALIELGREVVVLHKWTSEGTTRPTRLWIVDDGATAWFHHGYPDSAWIARLEQDPVVTIERAGSPRRYRATPDPGSHDQVHQLLREKYGIADWWVRFVTGSREHCPALPVRLEPIEG